MSSKLSSEPTERLDNGLWNMLLQALTSVEPIKPLELICIMGNVVSYLVYVVLLELELWSLGYVWVIETLLNFTLIVSSLQSLMTASGEEVMP